MNLAPHQIVSILVVAIAVLVIAAMLVRAWRLDRSYNCRTCHGRLYRGDCVHCMTIQCRSPYADQLADNILAEGARDPAAGTTLGR